MQTGLVGKRTSNELHGHRQPFIFQPPIHRVRAQLNARLLDDVNLPYSKPGVPLWSSNLLCRRSESSRGIPRGQIRSPLLCIGAEGISTFGGRKHCVCVCDSRRSITVVMFCIMTHGRVTATYQGRAGAKTPIANTTGNIRTLPAVTPPEILSSTSRSRDVQRWVACVCVCVCESSRQMKG